MNMKILHRIYFGFDGRPDPYLRYLETWKNQLPGYEIRHWNTSNLPLDICEYSRTMYDLKDHAFLSDYFRWWILREHGGVYLDADVEVVDGNKFTTLVDDLARDDMLEGFIGIDNKRAGWFTAHSMALKPDSEYARFMCSVYEGMGPVCLWRRKIFFFMAPQLAALYFAFKGHNPRGMGSLPDIDVPVVREKIKIYPQEYFSPMTPDLWLAQAGFVVDSYTPKTSLCHHFACSWHDKDSPYFSLRKNYTERSLLLSDIMENEAKKYRIVRIARRLIHLARVAFSKALKGVRLVFRAFYLRPR